MKNQRNSCLIMDLLQYIKCKLRCYRIIAVCISDCNCQCIDSGAFNKYLCIIRIRTADSMIFTSVFASTYQSQLSLYGCPVFLCQFYYLYCTLDIFFKWICRAVEHDGGKSKFQCFLYCLHGKSMIQMHCHVYFRLFCSLYHHWSHKCKRGVFQSYFCNLQDDRSVQFFCCLDCSFYHLHISNTECADSSVITLRTLQ